VPSHFRRRSGPSGGSNGPGSPVSPGSLFKPLKALFEFLELSAWEDGSERTTGTVLLFIEDGRWKACLNDRDAGLICFLSAETCDDLLKGLDEGLKEDTLDWRVSRSSQGKGGRRKS